MLKSSLCDYSDAQIHVKQTIRVSNTTAADADANNTNKKVIFKNCAPFTDSKSEINNVELYSAKDIDIVTLIYNLIEYSNNFSKIFGSLWQYYRDIPAVNNNGEIVDFALDRRTDSFNFKVKITGQTVDNGTKGFGIMVQLKYLSNFWRTLEMPWSANCVKVSADIANQGAIFAITETKLYVPVATLSTQDIEKLLQQLNSGFKWTINWNKYNIKTRIIETKQKFKPFCRTNFLRNKWTFILSFENDA